MALILNIDTATDRASVCLSRDGHLLAIRKNDLQKDHASWLHPAINGLIQETAVELTAIDAFAVTIGPGSYTGLRVGLAAAKGFCFALEKPLITVNTLLVMAKAAENGPSGLLCPMIDARRMEVFTALYSKDLETVKAPLAMILDENSFATELASDAIYFFGSGSEKFQKIIKNRNAFFIQNDFDATHLSPISYSLFLRKEFANLAYTEPLYLKEFYSPAR